MPVSLLKIGFILTIGALQSACSSLEKKELTHINCKAIQSSCHHGRFGLVWETTQADGTVNTDAISGHYEWRSTQGDAHQTPELAHLEVSSILGPSLGNAKRHGNLFEVRAADGRVYLAQDWQSLFNLMFPIELPAKALVQWMQNPNPDKLPPLPAHWSWKNQNGRYRIVFVENQTSGRIDLIPQGSLDQ